MQKAMASLIAPLFFAVACMVTGQHAEDGASPASTTRTPPTTLNVGPGPTVPNAFANPPPTTHALTTELSQTPPSRETTQASPTTTRPNQIYYIINSESSDGLLTLSRNATVACKKEP